MASTVTTDIAAELNITARRNDSFMFELEVDSPGDSSTNNSLPMVVLMTSSSANDNVYQGKMSIVDASTGDVKLNLYSARWSPTDSEVTNDTPTSNIPTATTAGNYYGAAASVNDAGGNAVKVGGAIDFSNMVGTTSTNRVKINAPYTYMSFPPGVYKYDLQIRKKTTTTAIVEYNTWLYGTFTLVADVTQL